MGVVGQMPLEDLDAGELGVVVGHVVDGGCAVGMIRVVVEVPSYTFAPGIEGREALK